MAQAATAVNSAPVSAMSAAKKSTAERVLDAAEELFAARGYQSTSLGDVAEQVGIRAPSLYNHFRNKEALYMAVTDRLVASAHNVAPLPGTEVPLNEESLLAWIAAMVMNYHRHPNLARLLQHEALSGVVGSSSLGERLFRPMFTDNPDLPELNVPGGDNLMPWAIIGFNNIVLSYITMAPVYEQLLGFDPLSEAALKQQESLLLALARRALGFDAA